VLSINVEARQTAEMAKTIILPTALRFQGELAAAAVNVKAAGINYNTTLLESVSAAIDELVAGIDALEAGLAGHGGDSTLAEARYGCDTLIPRMAAVRAASDTLETMIADDVWPLPTYQEMLFIL
jgi:glutamine synthetase